MQNDRWGAACNGDGAVDGHSILYGSDVAGCAVTAALGEAAHEVVKWG